MRSKPNRREKQNMPWIVDAHAQWHAVYGAKEVCPLDCGVGETYEGWDDEPQAEVIPVPEEEPPF
jgi:hypothetical protein